MTKKILFVSDWQDDNIVPLQKLLDTDYSSNYQWTVWSCKNKKSNLLLYRWITYFQSAIYIILNHNKYDEFVIWQQMTGYIVFWIKRLFPFINIPQIIHISFLYRPKGDPDYNWIKRQSVQTALKYSKAMIWFSSKMNEDVINDFPEYAKKNNYIRMPIIDKIETGYKLFKSLDNPAFMDGIFCGGKSERDFNIVIRAFKNKDVPVNIVCPNNYQIIEKDITPNIRVLRFSEVPHDQFYALLDKSAVVIVSVKSEKSPCGQLLISYALSTSKPLIATDTEAIKDFITNNVNGLLFPVGNEKAIYQAYEKQASDSQFRHKIISNGKQTANDMNPDNFIKSIISILE